MPLIECKCYKMRLGHIFYELINCTEHGKDNSKKNPRTHYIDELAKILELPEDVVQDVLDLTGDYMFSRYPDIGDKVPYEEYDEEIAMEKVTKAKGIFLKLKDFVKPIDDMLERENENEGE